MRSFLLFILRFFISSISMVIIWLFSFFVYHQSFLNSGFFAIIGAVVIYYLIKWINHYQFIRNSGLTRSEYRIVKENLKIAKQKIKRLQRAFFNVNNLLTSSKNFETLRVVRKIYTTTKKDPKRFFKVENFYYSHLDSLVELAEKHAFLTSQPVKTKELNDSLRETRTTITQISESIQEDLYMMLENDIDTLKFEIDVAKRTIEQKNEQRR